MTYEEARAAVTSYLGTLRVSDGAVILDEATIELPYGRVFFYQSETFARTGDPLRAYAGNGGILVLNESGQLHAFGSAKPTEWYLANFEASGDPSLVPGAVVELASADLDRSADAVRLLRSRLDLPLGELRSVLVAAASGSSPTLRTRSPAEARQLLDELAVVGVTGRQLPELAV